MNNYKLTPNELHLMELFWEINRPLTSVDLSDYVKEWKNGYLQNLLKSLNEKGMLRCTNIIQYKRQFAKQYEYTITREEYAAKMISSLQINKHSIPKIALALTKELSKDQDYYDEIISDLEEILEKFKNERNRES